MWVLSSEPHSDTSDNSFPTTSDTTPTVPTIPTVPTVRQSDSPGQLSDCVEGNHQSVTSARMRGWLVLWSAAGARKFYPSCPPPAIVQPAAGDEKFCPKNVQIYDFCSAAPAVSDEPQGSILRLLDWQKDVDSNMLEPSEVTTGGDTNTPSVTRKERSGSTHARNELRLELRVASDTTRNWVSRFRSKRLLEHCSQDAPSMVALR